MDNEAMRRHRARRCVRAWCAAVAFTACGTQAGIGPGDSLQAVTGAAEKGDAAAQLELADRYDLGRGVTRDYREAARWYRRAAEQGNAQAQFALAEMYKNGDGVAQDMQEALRWYRSAAEQGSAGAQLLLGVIYESGTGVPASPAEAAKWYRLSAAGGDARAQHLLANLYNAGQGVPMNAVAAWALYSVSLQREPRNNPSTGHRAQLEKRMTAQELERARELARRMEEPGKLLGALDRAVQMHPAPGASGTRNP